MADPGRAARPGLVAGVALALAVAALVSGWHALDGWLAHRRMTQEWPRAEAVVLRAEHRMVGSRSRQLQFHPVLAFTTSGGQVRTPPGIA
ncbi:MAG TPA: DUF3592 domain-containing protein [Acetobacteraceae bacterium]|nr:DUF3592 domain-containing protein [Acetobacteraceae bacterium]